MAQKINTNFQGSYYFETEPDAFTDHKTYGNIVGDNAHNFELARTGSFGGITVDHSGSGNGCLLGFPLINEIKQNYLVKTEQGDGGSVAWASPIFVPAGETSLFIQVFSQSVLQHSFQVFTAASGAGPVTPSTASSVGPMVRMSRTTTAGIEGYHSAWYQIGPNPSGLLLWAVVTVDADFNSEAFYSGVSIYFNRQRESNDGLMQLVDGSGSDYKCLTDAVVEADGTATVNAEQVIDEAFVAEDEPINGFVINRMNKQQNALTEYLTGAPAGQNAALTLESSNTGIPDRSAFYDHAEGGNNGWPSIQMPLGGSGVGSFGLGWIDWLDSPNAMPIGITAAGPHTNIAIYDEILYTPDMLIDGVTSQAKVTVALICAQDTFPACTVTVRVKSYNSSGSVGTETTNTISVSGVGIYFLTVNQAVLWRDRFNRLRISMNVDGNFKASTAPYLPSISLAGFCVYTI